jgi:hypothetical protein
MNHHPNALIKIIERAGADAVFRIWRETIINSSIEAISIGGIVAGLKEKIGIRYANT